MLIDSLHIAFSIKLSLSILCLGIVIVVLFHHKKDAAFILQFHHDEWFYRQLGSEQQSICTHPCVVFKSSVCVVIAFQTEESSRHRKLYFLWDNSTASVRSEIRRYMT